MPEDIMSKTKAASQLLNFTAEEVSKFFPSFTTLYDALRETLIEYSVRKSIVQPIRQQLNIPNTADRFISMPACIPSQNIMGIKVVCGIPSNVGKGLPTHLGMIQLYHLTGELLCQMDAGEITEKRTAVCSALATKALAHPDSKVLALIGAGAQAESHIWALRHLYNFDEIRIWNRTRSRAEKLAEKLACVVCNTVEDACLDADIVCTVTSSREPVLFKHHLKPGCHVNGVGASSPTTREIGDDLMLSDNLYLVADCSKAIAVESGDVVQTGVAPRCELGEILDVARPHDPQQITLFKNLGLACEDVVTADLVCKGYIADQ